MSNIDESLIDNKEYLVNLHTVFKHKINNPTDQTVEYAPAQMAIAFGHIKMRDAMLRTFFEEEDTLNNFITWWNDNNYLISGGLTPEQKANVLPLLAGALLLQGRWEETEAAIDLSIKYATENNSDVPGLTLLMRRSMYAGTMMGAKQDIIKLWRNSIEAVKLEEIFPQ